MKFIIIGDRFQKRMKSKGCTGLIQIKNKPIIEYQYRYIKRFFPESEIIYISGFEHKKLSAYISKHKNKYPDLSLVNNNLYEKYSYVYSLSLVTQQLNDDGFILFGDNVLNNRTFKYFSASNGSQIFIQSKDKYELGCIISDDHVQRISYDIGNYLANIYYLSNDHMLSLQKLLLLDKYKNYFLFEMINELINQTHNIRPFFI